MSGAIAVVPPPDCPAFYVQALTLGLFVRLPRSFSDCSHGGFFGSAACPLLRFLSLLALSFLSRLLFPMCSLPNLVFAPDPG
jgi:hypothetical protein